MSVRTVLMRRKSSRTRPNLEIEELLRSVDECMSELAAIQERRKARRDARRRRPSVESEAITEIVPSPISDEEDITELGPNEFVLIRS